MARAADYAENRLVCGMHRRRDIQAGQVLGTVVAEIAAAQARLPGRISRPPERELRRRRIWHPKRPNRLYRIRGFIVYRSV